MARVTIEGTTNSDVCGKGERHVVERTPRLDGLIRAGLVRVIREHPEVEPAPVKPARKRARRRATE